MSAPFIHQTTPRRFLTLASFVTALIFPTMLIANAVALLITGEWRIAPLAFVYNSFDYLGMPFVLLAIVFGHLSQWMGSQSRLTITGLIVSYSSLVGLFVTVIALLLMQH